MTSGLGAGEALMGVAIAALIVAYLTLPSLVADAAFQGVPGLVVFPLVLWFFYSRARREAAAGETVTI